MYICKSCFMFPVSFLEIKEAMSDALEPGLSAASWTHTSSAATREQICSTCISTCTDYQSPPQPLSRGPPFLRCPEGHSLTLSYAVEDEDVVVKEIVAMGNSSSERPPLTVAFLLCTCLQYSAARLQTSDLRRLLLLIASGVQSAMWVSFGPPGGSGLLLYLLTILPHC